MRKNLVSDSINEGIHKFYELGPQIGVGKFSVVKSAIEKSTSKSWAVKIMKKTVVEEQNIVKEIEFMQDAKHSNIIALHEIYETDSEILLVLELVTGGELFDKIVERVSYTEEDASKLICTLTKVVQFLHSKDIVHCDLKPENLLYSDNSESATIKLCDFGLSQRCPKGSQLKSLVGTLSYMAPEISTCTGYGKPVDMWSLGVIIYILLCGFPPFDESTGYYLEFPSPEWDNISDSAKNIIKALLVIDPAKRLNAEQTLKHPWVSGMNVGKQSIIGTLKTLREFNTLRRSGTMGPIKQSRGTVFELFPGLASSTNNPTSKRNSYSNIPIKPSQSMDSIPKIVDPSSVTKINNELKLSSSSIKNSTDSFKNNCNNNSNNSITKQVEIEKEPNNSDNNDDLKNQLMSSLGGSSLLQPSTSTSELSLAATMDLGGASSDTFYQNKINSLVQEKTKLFEQVEELKKEIQTLRSNTSTGSSTSSSSSNSPFLTSIEPKLKLPTHMRTDSNGSSYNSDTEGPSKKDKSKYGVDRIVSDLINEVDKLYLSKDSTEKLNNLLNNYKTKNQEKSLKFQYNKQKEKYKKLKSQIKNSNKSK